MQPPVDAADTLNCSYNKIHDLWSSYAIISPVKRGRKQLSSEMCYSGSTSPERIEKLQQDILDLNESETAVTLKKLRKKLLAEFNITVRNHFIRKIYFVWGTFGPSWPKIEDLFISKFD
jgi:hypothetical protein